MFSSLPADIVSLLQLKKVSTGRICDLASTTWIQGPHVCPIYPLPRWRCTDICHQGRVILAVTVKDDIGFAFLHAQGLVELSHVQQVRVETGENIRIAAMAVVLNAKDGLDHLRTKWTLATSIIFSSISSATGNRPRGRTNLFSTDRAHTEHTPLSTRTRQWQPNWLPNLRRGTETDRFVSTCRWWRSCWPRRPWWSDGLMNSMKDWCECRRRAGSDGGTASSSMKSAGSSLNDWPSKWGWYSRATPTTGPAIRQGGTSAAFWLAATFVISLRFV